MIIKCEKCQTKFRLDDSKVTDKGVKVRCTKCKQVFTVYKQASEELTTAEQTDTLTTGFIPPLTPPEPPTTSEDVDFSDSFTAQESNKDLNTNASAPDKANDFDTFDSTAISFESEDAASYAADKKDSASTGITPGEVDFSNFDFGDSEPENDSTPDSALSADDFTNDIKEPLSDSPKKEIPQGLDFSDDDMFGAVVQSEPEPFKETISFDFEEDSFAESMDVGTQDAAAKSDVAFSLDAQGETAFSLGEIDFGDELTSVAVQQVNPEDLKPSQEILFAPLAEAKEKPVEDRSTKAISIEETPASQEDLPPLSITSRRKQSPMLIGLTAVLLLAIIAVAVYFGFSSPSSSKDTTIADNGKITIRSVQASYLKNKEAGELLVISGEALNEYKKPQASLQVKVSVFDVMGQPVTSKSAYCGNPLTNEQLSSMTIDKIESAMSNQFGDSLANMEVAPGKSIPFVVVVANLPKNAKDYTVESAGSTIATGKQP